MGFLLGAFGKLMAGRRVRDLQARMMRVQSKSRRVARQVEKMSKMLETQKKLDLNNLSMQQQYTNMAMPNAIMQNIGQPGNSQLAAMMTGGADMTSMLNNQGANLSTADQQWMAAYSNMKTQLAGQNEMLLAQMKSQIEEKYENMNDIMLEPLKMEEDSLQTEKDSLETQLQASQADYEACKKMEQADAKNLAPNYTGAA